MLRLRFLAALCFASALVACGGQYDIDPSLSLATTTVAAPAASASAASVPAASAPAGVAPQLASASMPAPDCAPEGCASLRIIDGNAEAWRIDAARRSERDGQPLS